MKHHKKNLVFVISFLVISMNILLFSIPITDANEPFVSWFEDFDDGDISDWLIENGTNGQNPITIEITDEENVSFPYSLKISSPEADYYSANLTAPNVLIDNNYPYTIEFDFRWNAFHYHLLVAYENVYLVIDKPYFKIRYKDQIVGTHGLGSLDFHDYCPKNNWTHFKIEVDPNSNNFVLFADNISIGTANFGSYTSGYHGFVIRDFGSNFVEPDYLNNGYYDNLMITGVSLGDQPPVADFEYSPLEPLVNETVNFSDNSFDLDGNITSWSWDFGDGNVSSIPNPNHQYSSNGIYEVSLELTDDDGLSDDISKLVFVGIIPTDICALNSGWNLKSLPGYDGVNKTDLIILYDNCYHSWSQAVANIIISDYIFGWSGSSYIFADVLYPTEGYWTYAYQPCTLKRTE